MTAADAKTAAEAAVELLARQPQHKVSHTLNLAIDGAALDAAIDRGLAVLKPGTRISSSHSGTDVAIALTWRGRALARQRGWVHGTLGN